MSVFGVLLLFNCGEVLSCRALARHGGDLDSVLGVATICFRKTKFSADSSGIAKYRAPEKENGPLHHATGRSDQTQPFGVILFFFTSVL
jgi:hypothetical protein